MKDYCIVRQERKLLRWRTVELVEFVASSDLKYAQTACIQLNARIKRIGINTRYIVLPWNKVVK